MRTRVKICGITRPEDGIAAAHAGADAIGLVFYPNSPRHVEIDQAAEICRALPPFVTRVALFVNASAEEIADVIAQVSIDLIQFHGNECPDYCAAHGKPWIRAIRMKEGVDLHKERERFSAAAALLVDSYKPGFPGGTGEAFNWLKIPADLAGEVILAGGLNPGNVADAVRQVAPWAVDVSGGVEFDKGLKDAALIEEFIRGVQVGDRETE